MSDLRPTWTAPAWSVSTPTYPAGANAWNGQPVRHNAALDYWTPGQPLGIEDLNGILGTLGDAGVAAKTLIRTLVDQRYADPIMNWPIFSAVTGGATSVSSLAWLDATSAWYRASRVAGSPPIFEASYDGGGSWVALATITGHNGVSPILAASGVKLIAILDTQIKVYTPTTNTWSADIASGVVAPTHAEVFQVGGNTGFIAADNTGEYSAVTTNNGTTWSNGAFGAFGTTANFLIWRCASAAALVTAIPCYPGSSATNRYVTSPDGITWTIRTGPWSATDRPFGVAYSAIESLWMVCVTNGAGTNARFYTSPDAITWTLASTLTSVAPQEIACFDHLWLVYVGDALPGANNRVIFSLDSGASWRHALLSTPFSTFRFAMAPHTVGSLSDAGTLMTTARGAFGPTIS